MSAIHQLIGRLRLGTPHSEGGLTVFPLLDSQPLQAPPYWTLDEAIAQQALTISELAEGGSVPKLRVENHSPRSVLLVDGEELIGGKQNRSVNLTVLVPAHTTLEVPVSCVERGRWQERSASFATSAQTVGARTRARKTRSVSASLRKRGSRESDQRGVWEDIADTTSRTLTFSSTAAFSDVFDAHRDRIEQVAGAFAAEPGQVGAVFGLGGRVLGTDVFDSERTLRRLLPKLLRGYAVETLAGPDPNAPPPATEAVRRLLEEVASAPRQEFPGVGAGRDLRFDARGLSGGALVLGQDVVHLVAFCEADPAEAVA